MYETILKMKKLAQTAYAYVNNPQEIEVWLDEIVRVADEAAQQNAHLTGGTCPICGRPTLEGKPVHIMCDLAASR